MRPKRDFTKLLDINKEECRYLLERSAFLKEQRRQGKEFKPLKGKSLAMIFEKASTRTRISFEIGMWELGGYAVFLTSQETQIGRGEPVRDTARVLSRYVDAVMIRTYGQALVDELARWATVPLINGLSDLYHPCQILSDLLTIQELKGRLDNVKIAYIGDGNNVANSWLEASILLGLRLSVATPEFYGPNETLLEEAERNEKFVYTHDPREAADGADIVYTDVWVSMGQEGEHEERMATFAPFRIDGEIMKEANESAVVMHCLPAHRNKEVSDRIFEANQEIIFRQAENRLHAQKALLEWLMSGDK
ncbi:MAG: ornithine carbamoyltransferase [Syntrophobacterales bacterium]|jgi:ornithine carbamoyltransferase|nr:ornithine carbamoyltransferase [Syntrophobacterales bacterium]